jgi:DNA-binding protein H-NS
MSLDELWVLHEEVSALLLNRIQAEKLELERRLAILSGDSKVLGDSSGASALKMSGRRRYPRVLPKYQNPTTSETWSGRGKRPRWMVAALDDGMDMESFRIPQGRAKNESS